MVGSELVGQFEPLSSSGQLWPPGSRVPTQVPSQYMLTRPGTRLAAVMAPEPAAPPVPVVPPVAGLPPVPVVPPVAVLPPVPVVPPVAGLPARATGAGGSARARGSAGANRPAGADASACPRVAAGARGGPTGAGGAAGVGRAAGARRAAAGRGPPVACRATGTRRASRPLLGTGRRENEKSDARHAHPLSAAALHLMILRLCRKRVVTETGPYNSHESQVGSRIFFDVDPCVAGFDGPDLVPQPTHFFASASVSWQVRPSTRRTPTR